MSINEFKNYPRFQQQQIAGTQGKVILSKDTLNHAIRVYQLGDFFVEVWENQNNQMLDSIIAYKSGELLERFTDQINIDDL